MQDEPPTAEDGEEEDDEEEDEAKGPNLGSVTSWRHTRNGQWGVSLQGPRLGRKRAGRQRQRQRQSKTIEQLQTGIEREGRRGRLFQKVVKARGKATSALGSYPGISKAPKWPVQSLPSA
ncbi:hypothetical protein H105_02569 [Trichophyton soudanense CBS 452.61]|uniref:Uncharacterized protein n=1 Tax=Trichophyton soudanense CBS 452.61 TaxID=1215331 RepID=A0A022Y0B7_TRISD|nr:hypothetical protein H105_02569 [Trichophyton soudanense CBS 452.61]